jgi:hypothetical protein
MPKNRLSAERADDRGLTLTGRMGLIWARRPVQGNINALPAAALAEER